MAAIPTYATVIEKLFTLLDQVLNNYIYNGYSTLADHLRTPLGLAVMLYLGLLGIAMSQGWVRLSMGNFVKSAFKIGLIYSFAMNWNHFSYYVIQGIEGSAGQIGDWLVSASPIALPHFAGEGINGALQSVLIEVTRVGYWTWGEGNWHSWGPLLDALLIWGFGFISLLLAIIETLLAKMMLALLFTLAPLFISFTLFKPTQGMFDRWLGAICGFALFLVMIPAAIALSLNFLQWAIVGQYTQQAMNISLVGFVPIMIVGVLGVVLILHVTQYAKTIGGSVAAASGSALLAGAVGGFVGSSLSTARTVASPLRGVWQSGFLRPGQLGQKAGDKLVKAGGSLMEGIRQRLNRGA